MDRTKRARVKVRLITEITLSDLVRLAVGREAEVFALDRDRVLRLAFSDTQREHVGYEARVLSIARAAGAPVPTIHQIVTVDGRPGLILDRLAGPDLIDVLNQRPWLMVSIARTLGRVHADLHALTAPESLPPLRDELRQQLQSSLVPDDVRISALTTLDGLPDGESLCHRDFHPANVVRDGRRCVVVDWGQAARGDAAADVARTHLLLAKSALPNGMSPMTRVLARSARGVMVSSYRRSYHRTAGDSRRAVTAW